MKKMTKLKLLIAAFIPILLLFLFNEKFSSEMESKSEWNQIAIKHIKEKYGEQTGFGENYVSISKWIEVENQLSQDVIKEQQNKQKEMSKSITNDTLELVNVRQEFTDLSLEAKNVTAEMSKSNLPDNVTDLVLEYYNKKLDESNKKLESVSKNILTLSDQSANPNEIYFPEKVVYANVTIAFGGKLFGFNKITFPIIIDKAKKEVLDVTSADQFTAVSQIVQENEVHKQPANMKITFIILLSLLFVYAVHLIKRPRHDEAYYYEDSNNYINS